MNCSENTWAINFFNEQMLINMMNHRINIVIRSLLLVFTLSKAEAQEKQFEELQITSQPFRAGQVIHIELDVSKTDLDLPNEPIYALMTCYSSNKSSLYDTIMQTGTHKKYKASFTLPTNVSAFAMRFVQGTREVNNAGRGYIYPVHDAAGKEQNDTYLSLYRLFAGDYTAHISKLNRELATTYHHKWFERQDLHKLSFIDRIVALYTEKDTSALCKQLHSLSAAQDITEKDISLLKFYTRPCGREMDQVLTAEIKRRFPEGRWYWNRWTDSMRELPTIAEKKAWIQAFELAYPHHDQLSYSPLHDMYIGLLIAATKNFDLTTIQEAVLKLENNPDYYGKVSSINDGFLDVLMNKDSLLSEVVPIAARSMQMSLYSYQSLLNKPKRERNYLQLTDAKEQYYASASSYGLLLAKNKQYDSAVYYSKLAANYFEWKKPVYNDRYFEAAKHTLTPQQLYPQLRHAFEQEGYTVNMKKLYVVTAEAMGKTDGSNELDKLLAARKNKLKEELKEKLMSEPAQNFIIPGLNGGQLDLASLKGKVVLLDFWATWCGPCVASFPTMQQLVDANKNNNDVVIAFVDTWQKEENKFETVQQFFRQSAYRFDVYMDVKDEVVKQFGIRGIPTKIVIDKKGLIRFVSIGFNAEDSKAVEELEVMLEMANELST